MLNLHRLFVIQLVLLVYLASEVLKAPPVELQKENQRMTAVKRPLGRKKGSKAKEYLFPDFPALPPGYITEDM